MEASRSHPLHEPQPHRHFFAFHKHDYILRHKPGWDRYHLHIGQWWHTHSAVPGTLQSLMIRTSFWSLHLLSLTAHKIGLRFLDLASWLGQRAIRDALDD